MTAAVPGPAARREQAGEAYCTFVQKSNGVAQNPESGGRLDALGAVVAGAIDPGADRRSSHLFRRIGPISASWRSPPANTLTIVRADWPRDSTSPVADFFRVSDL